MLFLISSFMCDGIHIKYSRIMNNRFCKYVRIFLTVTLSRKLLRDMTIPLTNRQERFSRSQSSLTPFAINNIPKKS